ncbi:YraN family protein [Candidatus Uhrbacteria bacterium]|nr:YraN family protein [Candidatus Uhrbacteria bacterium]
MYAKHATGARGEDLACSFLVQNGMKIITRNYRIRGGEIDIIAHDGRELVFVEVKARRSLRFGYPEESVTRAKMVRLCRAIRSYLSSRSAAEPYRFDVIAIEESSSGVPAIRHIKNCELPDRF